MPLNPELDSFNLQLKDLRLDFDTAMNAGLSFSEVKKIYQKIKEVETLISDKQILLNMG